MMMTMEWDMDMDIAKTGLGSLDTLIVDSMVFSTARVRADDFDWDLERKIGGRRQTIQTAFAARGTE
jgi:hypothetical protein